MPYLTDLEGQPMTWAELHRRVADYYAQRAEQERFEEMRFEVYYSPGGAYQLRRPA